MNRLEELNDRIKELDEVLLEVCNWKMGSRLSQKIQNKIGMIKNDDDRDVKIGELVKELKMLREEQHDILADTLEYIPKSSINITTIEQVRLHLQARSESFHHHNYKIFASFKDPKTAERLKEVSEEEGFSALISWPDKNPGFPNDEGYAEIQNVLYTLQMELNEIDLLILGSESKNRWEMINSTVKMVIIDSADEEEFIKKVGVFRKDLDIVIYK